MVYTKKQIREKINLLLDEYLLEDACFLIAEGLSVLFRVEEGNIFEHDFNDHEVIGLMEWVKE